MANLMPLSPFSPRVKKFKKYSDSTERSLELSRLSNQVSSFNNSKLSQSQFGASFSNEIDPSTLLPYGDETTEFSEHFLNFEQDQLELLMNYSNSCQSQEELWRRENGVQDMKLWNLEKRTWILLSNLYRVRLTPVNTSRKSLINKRTPDAMIIDICTSVDKELQEYIVVKKWLEETEDPFEPSEVKHKYWESTRMTVVRNEKIGRAPSSQLITEFDLDAPIRQGRSLTDEDNSYEKATLRSIFEYIRRGQISQAIDLARQADTPARAASLWGTFLFNYDPNFSNAPYGNINRKLWKKACKAISNHSKIDLYERAIYASLCGNYYEILPVCKTWEDRLWAYYCTLIERKYEEYLKQYGTPSLDDRGIDHMVEDIPLEVIFKDADTTQNTPIDLYHLIQTKVILNEVDDLFAIFSQIPQTKRSECQLIRFMTHFILFLKKIGQPISERAYLIVQSYISLLIDCKMYDLVAMYVSELPQHLQIQSYAGFLQGLYVPLKMKEKYKNLALKFNLDYPTIALTVVENYLMNVVEEFQNRDNYGISTNDFDFSLSEKEQRQADVLEWLAIEDSLSNELLSYSTLLLSYYLGLKKIQAAKLVFESYGVTLAQHHQEFREFGLYGTIVNTILAYGEWSELFVKYSSEAESKESEKTLIESSKEMEKRFRTILMHDQLANPYLRRIYVPTVAINLHIVLFNTASLIPGNLQKCLELANLIADNTYNFYKEFDQNTQMPEFLSLVYKSLLAVRLSNKE